MFLRPTSILSWLAASVTAATASALPCDLPLTGGEDVPGGPPVPVQSAPAQHEAVRHDSVGRRPLEPKLAVRDLMVRPIVDVDEAGRTWVRSRDVRASFDAEGVSAYPIFGRASEREWPVRFELASVARGGDAVGGQALATPELQGDRMELRRAGLREVWCLGLDGLEQTFVFDELPGGSAHGDGDLVVRMDVETDLDVEVAGDEVRFVHPSFGGLTYGRAFVIDASGARQEIERTWTGDGIELRVPDAFLDQAVLPLTIDPVLQGFTNGFGAPDDRSPDVVYTGQTDQYLVCWEEYTSAVNADVYLTTFSSSGSTQGATIAVDATGDDWRTPRIAYAYSQDRALVVASVGLGTGNCRIRGQLIDVGGFTTAGAPVTISTTGNDKRYPDVGGTNTTSASSAYFCVAWTHETGPALTRAQYRLVDWAGNYVTSIHSVTDDIDNAGHTVLSNGLGDVKLLSDYWTMAWIRDVDDDGLGQVWARRVRWDGEPTAGGGNFLVDGNPYCNRPSVTSQFDAPLVSTGDRPSIVAYDKRYPYADHPSGYQRSILARVVGQGEVHGLVSINSDLEDFDGNLDQWGPAIVTDGRGFTLAYSEESWQDIGSVNYDVYMASGNIFERTNFVGLALSERHQVLGATSAPETQIHACSMWDGEATTYYDDGAIVWVLDGGTVDSYGTIAGATFDNPTFDAGDEKAIGMQFCEAFDHSHSGADGRQNSWLWVLGDRQLTSPHTVTALDLPPNQWGYLLCAPQSGNVNYPGGSSGHLCLGGEIGRYQQQVQSSGAEGRITTMIDPLALPSPTGPIAAQPGESWYFQLWHRDKVGGVSTSNFTNACRVVFQP